MKKRDGNILVEVPNRQAKDFYQKLKVNVPASLDLKKYKSENLKLKT